MRYHDLREADFLLPHVLVTRRLGDRLQAGVAGGLIVPAVVALDLPHIREAGQPQVDPRLAFSRGWLRPPVQHGWAFEIRCEIGPGTATKIGTGITSEIDIGKLQYTSNSHLELAGYASLDELKAFWHQNGIDLGRDDPWCWLIEFIFKG